MQVDFRQRYDLPENTPVDTSYVRQLETARQFFQTDDELLTRNYASAKSEVADWLTVAGAQGLYPQFERIRNGEPFNDFRTAP